MSAEIREQLKIKGHVRAVVYGPDGEVKHVRETDNMIVTVGKNAMMDQLLAAPTITKPTHMAVGTGNTAPALGQTALVTEIDRNALSSLTRSNNVVTAIANWAAGDATNVALAEVGVFSAASGVTGTQPMYARALFSEAVPKGANDTLQVTWTFTGG